MSWKPKEKDLSLEEAVELAKKELAPFWFGSSPQIAGIRNGEMSTIFPLNPDFSKKSWLIFLLDPTTFLGESAFIHIREWWKRYHPFELELLVIIAPTYKFLKVPETVQQIIEKQQVSSIVVVDLEEALTKAFEVKEVPKVFLLSEEKKLFDHSGQNWLDGTESQVQKFLRQKDPGLAFSTILHLSQESSKDVGRFEFGFQAKFGKPFDFGTPGFVPAQNGCKVGKFPDSSSHRIPENGMLIVGNWLQDDEKIMTSDVNAKLTFLTSSRFSFIAQTHSKTTDISVVSIEKEGMPAYESIMGEHLLLDDTGQSVVKVSKPQVYHVLTKVKEKSSEITLRFPNANVAPISFYGMRFGD